MKKLLYFPVILLVSCSQKTEIENLYDQCNGQSCILDLNDFKETKGSDFFYFPEYVDSNEISDSLNIEFQKEQEFACTIVIVENSKIKHVEYWPYYPENNYGMSLTTQYRNTTQHFNLYNTMFIFSKLRNSRIVTMEPLTSKK